MATYLVCWNPGQNPPVYFIDPAGSKSGGDISVKNPTDFTFEADKGCSAQYPFNMHVSSSSQDVKVVTNDAPSIQVVDSYQKVNEVTYLDMTLKYANQPPHVIEGRKPVIRNDGHVGPQPSYIAIAVLALVAILLAVFFWRRRARP
jgi:hypothetical protein